MSGSKIMLAGKEDAMMNGKEKCQPRNLGRTRDTTEYYKDQTEHASSAHRYHVSVFVPHSPRLRKTAKRFGTSTPYTGKCHKVWVGFNVDAPPIFTNRNPLIRTLL